MTLGALRRRRDLEPRERHLGGPESRSSHKAKIRGYEADDCGGSEVTAGSFEVGKRYKISAVGTSTRWHALGARASDLGTTFVATAAGGSTTDGKAELVECPLQSVDTADTNADGSLTATEKAAYLLYDICSCYHDTGAGQISNEICGELAQSLGQVIFVHPFLVCCRGQTR